MKYLISGLLIPILLFYINFIKKISIFKYHFSVSIIFGDFYSRNNYIYVFSGILLCAISFSLGDVESEFKKAKIEPDIIDKAPIDKIEVCINQIA